MRDEEWSMSERLPIFACIDGSSRLFSTSKTPLDISKTYASRLTFGRSDGPYTWEGRLVEKNNEKHRKSPSAINQKTRNVLRCSREARRSLIYLCDLDC